MKKILVTLTSLIIIVNIVVNVLFYNKINKAKEQIAFLNDKLFSVSARISNAVGGEEVKLNKGFFSFDKYLIDPLFINKEVEVILEQVNSLISFKDGLAESIYNLGQILDYNQEEKKEELKRVGLFNDAYNSINSFLNFYKDKHLALTNTLKALSTQLSYSLDIDTLNFSVINENLKGLEDQLILYVDCTNTVKKAFEKVFELNRTAFNLRISSDSEIQKDIFSKSLFTRSFNNDHQLIDSKYNDLAVLSEDYEEQVKINQEQAKINQELEVNVASLSEENIDLQKSIGIIEGKLEALLSTNEEKANSKKETIETNVYYPFISGRITKYNNEYSFVILDKGKHNSVEVGTIIVIKREGTIVCNARVTEVYGDFSVAEIESNSLTNVGYPRYGDLAIKL